MILSIFTTIFSQQTQAIRKLDGAELEGMGYFMKAAPYSATCKIYGNDGSGGCGTGTLITDDHGHMGVVTAAHVAKNLTLGNMTGEAPIITQKEIDEDIAFPSGSFIDIQTYTPEDNLKSFAVWPSQIVYLGSEEDQGNAKDLAILLFKGQTLKRLVQELSDRKIKPINMSKANPALNMDKPLDTTFVGYGSGEYRFAFKNKLVTDDFRKANLQDEVHLCGVYEQALLLEQADLEAKKELQQKVSAIMSDVKENRISKDEARAKIEQVKADILIQNINAKELTLQKDAARKEGMYFDCLTGASSEEACVGSKGDSGASLYHHDENGTLHLIAINVASFSSATMRQEPGIGQSGYAPLVPNYGWIKDVLSRSESPFIH